MVYPRFDLKRYLPWILIVVVGLLGAYFLMWR